MEELVTEAVEIGRLALAYINRPAFISQAIVIIALFACAYGLAWWAAPRLEAKAREIKGWPSVLRLMAILLQRLVWIGFVGFLTIAYVLV
ncbi:MAG TPA: hypothetical protein VNQ14_10580, partial [Woeseiaceae bacterium]|nr:hypothetical protein [Woeseiaceae bacterium]